MTTTATEPKTCDHKLFNCNCWYVVNTADNTLIHRAVSYDVANQWRLAQPDAAVLKMTPWAHNRELIAR